MVPKWTTLADRFLWVLADFQSLGISVRALSYYVTDGANETHLGVVKSRGGAMDSETLRMFCERTRVRAEWLLFGNEPVYYEADARFTVRDAIMKRRPKSGPHPRPVISPGKSDGANHH